jgi:predicted NBD/HSP70 family sugar kinase
VNSMISTMADHSSIIGVDLGGTKMAVSRFDAESFEVRERTVLPTHADQTFSHVLDDLVALLGRMREKGTRAVGVGIPGLVQQPEGTVRTMPNIPESENIALKDILEERLCLAVRVENDANCFALAEALHGAGKGERVVVGITMGTGVGGGIVLDGEIYHGATGLAGEVGHMLLRPGEPPFLANDVRGDVEQFLSGSSMGKRCEAAERPEEYLEGEVCSFLRPQVFQEVAWLCTSLTHLLDPSVIIFGGSAGLALGEHLDRIREELKQWLLPGTPLPRLCVSTLQNSAELGAALLHL